MIPNRAANDVVSLLRDGKKERGDRRGRERVDEKEGVKERMREGKERFVGEKVSRRGCS